LIVNMQSNRFFYFIGYLSRCICVDICIARVVFANTRVVHAH
jgi:hypothetical protein